MADLSKFEVVVGAGIGGAKRNSTSSLNGRLWFRYDSQKLAILLDVVRCLRVDRLNWISKSPSEDERRIVSDISLETFAGVEVVDELGRLREQYATTGAYPVLLGDEDDCDHIQECMEFGADDGLTQSGIRAASLQIDPQRFLAEQGECVPSDGQPGEWPTEEVEPIELVTYLDLETGTPKEEVAIALLRIRQPWEVFAALMWGGWNACADAASHCAAHRRWYEKFGAEVVSVTGDCVQCWVARPPATQEEALELAWEQYAYCPDIVLQGTETVSALAAALMVSEFWYFWWE